MQKLKLNENHLKDTTGDKTKFYKLEWNATYERLYGQAPMTVMDLISPSAELLCLISDQVYFNSSKLYTRKPIKLCTSSFKELIDLNVVHFGRDE